MGTGVELICRKCRYSFRMNFGVGFGFPQFYREIIEEAKAGKLGESVQAFLRDHTDGALDCDQVLLQCTSCDKLDRGIDLSMYIPKDRPVEHDGIWTGAFTFEGIVYVAPWELKKHYKLVKRYDHVCRKCRNQMRVIREKDLIVEDLESDGNETVVNVRCPKCHRPMVMGEQLMWD